MIIWVWNKKTSSSSIFHQIFNFNISELPKASLSKRGLVHNHPYENEFNLHVNEISFSHERMSTKTRFEKEAKGNSEMAYYPAMKKNHIALMFSRN